MALNRDSILSQIALVESNISRLKTLVECDMVYMPDASVPTYCCMKAIHQLLNIQTEITGHSPILFDPKQVGDDRT